MSRSSTSAPQHSETQIIRSESQEPTHYARVPRMARLELDPYEMALYIAYKDNCAVGGGECEKTNPELAKEAQMSVTKVKAARHSLEQKGYIRVQRFLSATGHDYAPPNVTIIDVWAENERRYGGSHDATGGSRQKTTPPSPHDYPPVIGEGGSHDTPTPPISPLPERRIEGAAPVVPTLDSAGASVRADSIQESLESENPKDSKDQEQKEKEKRLKDSREAWMKGLSLLLNIREDAYAQGQKYINFFQGKSPKEKGGKWDQFKIDNSEIQVNAVVVYAFAYWWTRTYKGMTIRKLETIREYFDLFTALKNYDDHITHAEKDLKALLGLNEVVKREIVTDPEAYAELERLRELAAKMAHEGANPWQTLQKQMAG